MNIQTLKKITIVAGFFLYLISVITSVASQLNLINGNLISLLAPRDLLDMLTILAGFGFYILAWKDSKIAIYCFGVLYGIQMLSTNLTDVVSQSIIAYNLTCLASAIDGFILAFLIYPRIKASK